MLPNPETPVLDRSDIGYNVLPYVNVMRFFDEVVCGGEDWVSDKNEPVILYEESFTPGLVPGQQ